MYIIQTSTTIQFSSCYQKGNYTYLFDIRRFNRITYEQIHLHYLWLTNKHNFLKSEEISDQKNKIQGWITRNPTKAESQTGQTIQNTRFQFKLYFCLFVCFLPYENSIWRFRWVIPCETDHCDILRDFYPRRQTFNREIFTKCFVAEICSYIISLQRISTQNLRNSTDTTVKEIIFDNRFTNSLC